MQLTKCDFVKYNIYMSHHTLEFNHFNDIRTSHNLPTIQSAYSRIIDKQKQELTSFEKFAIWLTNSFGTIWSLLFHVVWFGAWIIINLGLTPIKPFDPFPFGFLTLVVSLEAIFLSIIILISENREEQASKQKEELSIELLKTLEIRLNMLLKHQIEKDLRERGK